MKGKYIMSTKKVVALCMAVALIASAFTGVTIAYLTDTETEVNVMTVGKVNIELIEQQRAYDEKGDLTGLEDFEQGKQLLPIVGSAQGEKDEYGMPTAANYVDKIVNIENTGINDAYVRILVAVPAVLEESTQASAKNALHWNLGNRFFSDGSYNKDTNNANANYADITMKVEDPANIDGIEYNVYSFTYQTALKAGKTTDAAAFVGFYLDEHIDCDPDTGIYYLDGQAINFDFSKPVIIPVAAQAVQASGFETADDAFTASGLPTNPWEEVVVVKSAEEVVAALDNGAYNVIIADAEITSNPFNGHYYKDRNIEFVNCTFTANMNYMYINDVTFDNCTFDVGSANSAVHYDELFGDAVFNNCTFKTGKIQIGANKDVTGTVTFNDCVFENTDTTSIWAEKGIRVYSPAEFNGCEFNNRVVLAGANELPITFDTCTMNGGTPVYYVDNTDGIIRGGNVPAVTIK